MSEKIKRYMLDIETLGVGGCPVIIQIGCVNFDLTQEIDLKFDIDNQKLSTKSQCTIEFWSDKKMPKGQLSLMDGLIKLKEFLKYPDEVWSHDFDISIIRSVCDIYKIEMPYHYTKFMDIRTLVKLSGIDLKKYNWDNKTHNAVDDCKFQIGYCIDAFKKLNNFNPNKKPMINATDKQKYKIAFQLQDSPLYEKINTEHAMSGFMARNIICDRLENLTSNQAGEIITELDQENWDKAEMLLSEMNNKFFDFNYWDNETSGYQNNKD